MKLGVVFSVEVFSSIERPLRSPGEMPFGVATIATVLKVAGHDVSLFVMTARTRLEAMLRPYIEAERPRLFCFSAVSTQFPLIVQVAQLVKHIDPSIITILGGHHASLAPEEAIGQTCFDAICVGEGEMAVVEFAARIAADRPLTGIGNLWVRDAGAIVKGERLPLLENLDALPLIDRGLWNRWIADPTDEPSILLGRGCPYKCTYCSNHAMAQLSSGRYVRFRSPNSIVDEIRNILTSHPGVSSVYLEIETIGANIHFAFALMENLIKYQEDNEQKLEFRINFALTSVFFRDNERAIRFFDLLKKANVRCINIGLESGSERIRADVLRRPKYSNADIRKFCDLARDYGIEISLYVLMGLPGESVADFMETVGVVRAVNPQHTFLSIFYPYPGTDLARLAVEQNLIDPRTMGGTAERARAYLRLPGFPRWRVRLEYVLFWFRAYGGRWPLIKLLVRTIVSFLQGYPAAESVFRHLATRVGILARLRHRYRANASATKANGENPV